jgi:ferredoxin/flavodoxin---NADP+ reductase
MSMALQWITGTVAKKHVWSEGLFTLSIHCPGVGAFEPGQFLQVGVPLPDKHLHRPYSVASPHGETLEFFIVKVDGGELTPRLWEMTEGTAIDVAAKATGGFTLSHTPQADCIWLLATGTGLAPYIAMLRESAIWNQYQKIVLVHGVRYKTDLAYLDELHQWEAQYADRFRFIGAVSRETVEGCITGRVTNAIESGLLESTAGVSLKPETSAVMMCGNPDMLNDVESLLQARGLKKHKAKEPGHYVVERYW